MQIALWLAVALLAIVWIVWPSAGRRPPVLLLIRNRGEEVEGVVRMLSSAGHLVMALDLGSSDDTPEVLRRLAYDGTAIRVLRGGIDELLASAQEPAVVVLRLDEHFGAKDALGALRIGR